MTGNWEVPDQLLSVFGKSVIPGLFLILCQEQSISETVYITEHKTESLIKLCPWRKNAGTLPFANSH